MKLKVKVDGTEEVIKELEKAKDLEKVDKTINVMGHELLYRVTDHRCPVDTGRYRAGWFWHRLGKLRYMLANPVEYASFLIYGTIKMPVKHDVRGIVDDWKRDLIKVLRKI